MIRIESFPYVEKKISFAISTGKAVCSQNTKEPVKRTDNRLKTYKQFLQAFDRA